MLGFCELNTIPAFCDPYKTQEAGCVCRDAEGFLLDASGNRVPLTMAPAASVFGAPGLDSKTVALAVAALVVLLAVRR